MNCSFWYVDHENIISKPTKECENQSKKCIAHLRNHLCRLTLLWLLMSEKQSNIALLPLCLVRGRARQSEGNRMQKGNSHQESHQCITNVVKSSAIPSGILRMNGFYCSVLITDCCYSSSSFYCICAVVDRVLMMMVMIMTLLLDGVMKTRLKKLSSRGFLLVWKNDQLTFCHTFRECQRFEGLSQF